MVKINERLHLVIPIYADDNETIHAYVHSAPISREVFEAHFMLLSKTFATIHTEGLGIIAGPRVAALVLQDVAKRQRDEVGALALTNEIRRLSNVLLRSAAGWSSVPFQEVADRGLISADDLAEVLNALTFFTLCSSLHKKQDLKEMVSAAANLWGARISSSDFTGFAASLTTSTAPASTGVTHQPVSSVIS